MPDIKQHIAAARKVYETYWDSYTKGDPEIFATTLDETYEMIGTSETEVCHTKTEGIEFLKAQIAEIVGKAELRNRQVKVVPVDQLVLINEHSDIYVLSEGDWILYSKIRISTWLRKTERGWKVVQQHGSLPDMRVQEGETMAIKKINRENLELRDAIKRRTLELEQKNRELEIETALERVRTAAMAMKKPADLLDVCQIISEQLEKLNVGNIRNTQLAIIDEARKNYANYQYFNAYSKRVFEETNFEDNRASNAMVREMQKSANSFFIGSIQGEDLQEFREWRKKDDQFPDPLLDETPAMYYYFYSIGKGGLGLTTYQEISGESLEIFKRFHKIFTLAYRRFIDIQQAEAQAFQARQDLIAIKTARQNAEKALNELQATQTQLIHAEKMASLGELTAGIAHEIQNPLNFVNNFSELSTELIDEMKQELAAGSKQSAVEISDDIKQNLEKILHHGKRADGIVKGMLQHSRMGSGHKELTDINELADEYLRLAYHGLRAKDKTFNADFKLEADEQLPKVNVVPQDIGRVLLNLINNAFHAVSVKSLPKADETYKPQVIISTSISHLEGGLRGVLISVRDNGPGIPDEIKDKIFQPFFTTKPTGEGTGLGLSLSYDIVTKGHDGDIRIESTEGKGTTVNLMLPL